MRTILIGALATSFAVFGQVAPASQRGNVDVDAALRRLGTESIRGIDSDICLPSTPAEYEAMGKHAILMLTSSTAVATELPLRSVYVMYKGVRVPLQRIATMPKQEAEASGRATQVSFYLLPIQFIKRDASLLADFTGDRAGFGISTFSAQVGLDKDSPAFARLDEYDTPRDADMATVGRVMAREYPDYAQ